MNSRSAARADAVQEAARGAAKAGQWAVALQKAEEAVQLGAGVDALAIAALGACNLKNPRQGTQLHLEAAAVAAGDPTPELPSQRD